LHAQDDLEALLQQNLGGQQKPPAAEAPKNEAPAPAEKPAEPAPAPAEKPAEAAPAVAEKPAEPAPAPAEKPADAAPAVADKPAEPALAPADKPAQAAPVAEGDEGDQSSLVSELLTLEKIRRQSLDDHGYAALEVARKALRDGDYPLAREQYKQAIEFIGNRPANQAARQEAKEGMAEAFYREAKLVMKQGDIEKALPLAGQAKEHGHPQAARLLEALKKPSVKEEVDITSVAHRVHETDYKANQEEIRKRLRRSRQYYTTGEYGKALEECELVLRDNPYHTEAMELRERIADRMKTVADIEFDAARSLMIADVRKTWTPERYAIDSVQLPAQGGDVTSKKKTVDGTKRTDEQMVNKKLREIVIPEVTFRPPATIIDAVDFFKQASRDYDNPEIPVEQRGVNIVLKLGAGAAPAATEAAPADPFAPAATPASASGVPVISSLSARFINLYDALKLVCDVTGMKFRIRGNIVMIVPLNDPESELITRSYNVLESLVERKQATLSDLQPAGGRGGGDSTFMSTSDMGGKEDWKTFFQELGVMWPDGSSISYMSSIGKIRVTNTAEQLAVFEQALEDLNVTPRLIEIEARFVEVSQKDLNSLGFEWLLNSDYSFNVGGFLDKALNLQEFSGTKTQLTDALGNLLYESDGVTPLYGYKSYQTASSGSSYGWRKNTDGTLTKVLVDSTQYAMTDASTHNMGVSAIDGTTYSTGNRYLSTTGNPISGEGKSTNDQFMRVNAFLGNADISMILHMLSQRSDTDLLSAPKVVTKSGQEAVMKVVTEYIYPTEFEVTGLQSGGGYNGGTSTTTGAVVEPQNFEMREVGIILQVVPEVSAEGQMINLMLNPQVVSEPVWKNYGAKIPVQRQSSITANLNNITDPTTLSQILNPEPEYMELPMEQPFFHVRSVQTQLSIYNGATVVMGGLITESRKTIEDKIPFLGDLPYVGRLFRSRSEESDKRNLLVFVTARLVDPSGRAVRVSGGESSLMSGQPAQTTAVVPKAAEPIATP